MEIERKPCTNFKTKHPLWDGSPSCVCTGCLNRLPIRDNGKLILSDGKENCKNFKTQMI